MRRVFACALLAFSFGNGVLASDDPVPTVGKSATEAAKPVGIRELSQMFNEPVDLTDFPKEGKLGDVLKLLQTKFSQKGKQLPIVIDRPAFLEEYPEAEAAEETEVRLPIEPRRMSCGQLLRSLVSQLKTDNATCWVRPGFIEITTHSAARVEGLLYQKVHVRFHRRPLADALEDLYELTGVAVNLDSRAAPVGQMPISANFANDVSVGTVLLMLSEMAGLKLLVGDNVVYMTTPPHARQFLFERAVNPYGLPPLSGHYFQAKLKRIEAAE